jgi:hypothetical protein
MCDDDAVLIISAVAAQLNKLLIVYICQSGWAMMIDGHPSSSPTD